MMATAIACHRQGMDFAAVHDGFWTHAADGDKLHEALRREFTALHAVPLLDDLYQQWRKLYPHKDLPKPPPPGDMDIEESRKSAYLFS
jgi:DNA-directed RNA polymerase